MTNRFDLAAARLPETGPSDPAGRLRYERLKRLVNDLGPGPSDPESPAVQFARALATLRTLHDIIPNNPEYAAMRGKVGNRLREEVERGLPKTDEELLDRVVSLNELLKEAQEFKIDAV
jgi:hypothetical protein